MYRFKCDYSSIIILKRLKKYVKINIEKLIGIRNNKRNVIVYIINSHHGATSGTFCTCVKFDNLAVVIGHNVKNTI